MLRSRYCLLLLSSIFLLSAGFTAVDYTGDNLLLLLGTNSTGKEFKAIKDFWLLDKNMQNEYGGIKLTLNSAKKVQSILIAGENFQQSGAKFTKCTSSLPYHILLSDDTATLNRKLSNGQKIIGRSAIKYYEGDVAVEVSYTDLKSGKISCIKFYNELKPSPVKIIVAEEKKEPTAQAKLQDKRNQLEQKVFATPQVKAEIRDASISAFKQALLDVFKSYKESNFYSIKNGLRSGGNFWKYQYTYSTKLKIPGEKFNMLYCFPFQNSPLDFVSVIKEADAYDASFLSSYKEWEKKLMKEFPESESWKASCIANKESKTLSDLEFSNDKYGSVVLDYSKSPKGRHILYLRFPLYSN